MGFYKFSNRTNYKGEYKNDKKHGFGWHNYPNGDIYEGNFAHNKREGKGKLTHRNGCSYDGHWENDRKTGSALETYPNGGTYEGEFRLGTKSGQGTLTKPDGYIYEGGWSEGMTHGIGKEIFAELSPKKNPATGKERVFKGNFEYGKRSGLGIVTYLDGSYYSGHWKGGFKEGRALAYDSNRNTWHLGEYRQNKIWKMEKNGSGKPDGDLDPRKDVEDLHLDDSAFYTDSSFPANLSALFAANQAVPSNMKEEFAQLQWQRLARASGGDTRLFPNEVLSDEKIHSADLSSPSLITVLKSLCVCGYENVIRRLFDSKTNVKKGYIVVNLHRLGRTMDITIDDQLCVLPGSQRPAFSSYQPDYSWLPLLEKAFAKLVGGYYTLFCMGLEGIMADLTGAPVKTLKNDQGSISRNLRTIASALVNGAMILCVSEDESSIHLVTSLGDTKTTRAGGGAKKVNSLRLRRIMPQLSQVEEQEQELSAKEFGQQFSMSTICYLRPGCENSAACKLIKVPHSTNSKQHMVRNSNDQTKFES
mmetsp:Transcript_44264/g.50963  ORF Transcript_44264/g.50963 Transcript_44264/m.50963 type:complete len:532 (+) Transcript_44264:716-2311(+)